MDMYAVVLYFDEDASSKLNRGIKGISDVSGNRYMLDVEIPPHITIGAFLCDEPTELLEKVREFAAQVKQFPVRFEKVGAFGTKVLFASPIKDECLASINVKINELLLGDFAPADNENYIPEKWIPHCALAVRLDDEQFQVAKEIQLEFPLVAQVEKLALARCNPYKELEIWEL